MCFHLAQPKWPGLRLTRKFRDRGADAIDQEQQLALASGWNGNLKKLRDDCHRLTKARPQIRKVVFATSLGVDEMQIKEWQDKIKDEFQIELVDVIQRD
jgi:hypothetical protein